VARGGFEPPKALGRQIYSLLRLTAPQPRLLLYIPNGRNLFSVPPLTSTVACDTAFNEIYKVWNNDESWSWRRDLNPRPADYKSAALPD
ncbi:uncharacterized protein METZ01_LOCUS30118, partial [marine metagenome]